MRVLIDECLPRPLAAALTGVDAKTVPDAGWAGQSNGALLDLAERELDGFVTIDRSLEYQQRFTGRDLGVVLVAAPSNRMESLAPLVPRILAALASIDPGEVIRVGT